MYKWLISIALLSTIAVGMAATYNYPTTYTSYYCLDPGGEQFHGGTIGPVKMWFSPADQAYVPSAYSRQDGCEQIIRLCNQRFPNVCKGDCLAGAAVSSTPGSNEATCEGTMLMSPPKSEIYHYMETNP
jgi:hypothetical protein